MAAISTIDFSPFMKSEGAVSGMTPTPEQLEVAEQIHEAFRDQGFLFLEGIGVSSEDLQTYYEMSASLFALPEEHKQTKLSQIDENTNAGYCGRCKESLNVKRSADLKELFNIANPAVIEQDFSECPPGFGKEFTTFWDQFKMASQNFGIACAVALGLPRDYFLKVLEKLDLSVIRLIYYPPCDYAEGMSTGDDPSASLRVGEHTDFGLFTFLFCDGPGLQVKKVEGGEVEGGEIAGASGGERDSWLDVPVPTDATVIVNTGALMERWTNDVWRATAHRVVVSSPLQAMSHRFAIACFVEPDEGSVVAVDPKFVKPGEKAKYEPILGTDYLRMRLGEIRLNVK